MDRFLESADSEKKVKSRAIQVELTACRERIAALTQGPVRIFSFTKSHSVLISIVFIRAHHILTLLTSRNDGARLQTKS